MIRYYAMFHPEKQEYVACFVPQFVNDKFQNLLNTGAGIR